MVLDRSTASIFAEAFRDSARLRLRRGRRRGCNRERPSLEALLKTTTDQNRRGHEAPEAAEAARIK